jgi:hypothetical protein
MRKRVTVGDRFGRLVVVELIKGSRRVKPRALCLCDCDTSKIIIRDCLTGGSTKSCGCLHRETSRRNALAKTKHIAEPGMRFGRLLVIQSLEAAPGDKRKVVCRCDCGANYVGQTYDLVSGNTSSCGCLKSDSVRSNKLVHGDGGPGSERRPEYSVWASMVQRCTNPNCADWEEYGGRGIRVCLEWLHPRKGGTGGYPNFISDMGYRPTDNHSIDRIDPNGNYCPTNCKWSTATEQRLNQRRMSQ